MWFISIVFWKKIGENNVSPWVILFHLCLRTNLEVFIQTCNRFWYYLQGCSLGKVSYAYMILVTLVRSSRTPKLTWVTLALWTCFLLDCAMNLVYKNRDTYFVKWFLYQTTTLGTLSTWRKGLAKPPHKLLNVCNSVLRYSMYFLLNLQLILLSIITDMLYLMENDGLDCCRLHAE